MNRLLPANREMALGYGGDSASQEAMVAAMTAAAAVCVNGRSSRMVAKTKGAA